MATEIAVDFVKRFRGQRPIRAQMTYPVESSTVLILFGPSGAGKTTILRSLAGLEWPEEGSIRFISRTWLDTANGIRVPPQDRQIGYMAQDYALFPTLTVEGNIAYGLAHLPAHARARRVDEVVESFQLRGLERSKPGQLSGGQQQRVALARAVAPCPLLLLLDEPLSALDIPARFHLRHELRALLTQLALPSIIVTHDWAEALVLGDVMAVVSGGEVLQIGAPMDVFSRPVNAEVARVVGVESVLKGTVVWAGGGLVRIDINGVVVTAMAPDPLDAKVFVCIRAEDVTIERGRPEATSARNSLSGIVTGVTMLGAMAHVGVDCGFGLTALVTRSAVDEMELATGAAIVAAVKAGAVHVVSRQKDN